METTDLLERQANPPLSSSNPSHPAQQVTIDRQNRFWVELFNTLQIIGSEAYINGFEIPDTALTHLLDTVLGLVKR